MTITREQFAPIEPLLHNARRATRPRRHDLYSIFKAAMAYRAGCTWRKLPTGSPPWRTVYEAHAYWSSAKAPSGLSLMDEALTQLGRSDLVPHTITPDRLEDA